MEVHFGKGRGSIFALFDVAHKFGRRNPTLGIDVVNGKLHALGIMFRKQMDMFATDFDFSPHALCQHP